MTAVRRQYQGTGLIVEINPKRVDDCNLAFYRQEKLIKAAADSLCWRRIRRQPLAPDDEGCSAAAAEKLFDGDSAIVIEFAPSDDAYQPIISV